MKLTPLGDRVVLKQLEAEQQLRQNRPYNSNTGKNHRKQKLLQSDLEQKM